MADNVKTNLQIPQTFNILLAHLLLSSSYCKMRGSRAVDYIGLSFYLLSLSALSCECLLIRRLRTLYLEDSNSDGSCEIFKLIKLAIDSY